MTVCAPVESVSAGFSATKEEIDVEWVYESYPGSEFNKFWLTLFYEDEVLPGWWHKLAKQEASGLARSARIPSHRLWRLKTLKVEVVVVCAWCKLSEGVESDSWLGPPDWWLEDFENPDWAWEGTIDLIGVEDFEDWPLGPVP